MAMMRSSTLTLGDDTYFMLPDFVPESVPSIDVLFNGWRVWSLDLTSSPQLREKLSHPWPAPLRHYLDGTAHVAVTSSVTDDVLWEAPMQFGTSDQPIDVVDAMGRHVAINKWGRLGRTFNGADDQMRTRILDHLDILCSVLQDMGVEPFVVGGTLLGAVRGGALLPHDDDADIAYLSPFTHPADVALENGRIYNALISRGYEIVRHSNAHLQVTYRSSTGLVDTYIDIFAAYYTEDGQINQPFHVRGPLPRESMLPFSTVTLEGRSYPAPAVPEDWLVVNYDENWRTPLPGYRLRTPRATVRRFRNSFGSYNFQRDYWEERYLYRRGEQEVDVRGAHYLADRVSSGDVVLDLGCGGGEDAVALAKRGLDVVAVDYSSSALAQARSRLDSVENVAGRVDLRVMNLIDLREVAPLIQTIGAGGGSVHVLADHVLERMGHHGRATVLRVIRRAVVAGGTVVAVIDTVPAPRSSDTKPWTWHLTIGQIEMELAELGLAARPIRLHGRPRDHRRQAHLLEITLMNEETA